jgi:O-antigen ligase
MIITADRLKTHLIYVVHFLSFVGYSICMMVLTNLGLLSFSRMMTIPIRLLIVACLLCVLFLSRKVFINAPARIFILFSLIYVSRILFELVDGTKIFHQTPLEYLLYFASFAALPFLIVSSLHLKAHHYNIIRSSILFSGFMLSLLTLFFYKSIIGTIGRITEAVTRDDNYISPLALSYCSVLVIGVGLSYLLENKVTLRTKMYIITTIGLSLVPFYLGSSRGSVFALFLPFLLIFICKKNIHKSIWLLLVLALLAITGIYLSSYFGSNIIDRFTSIEADIEAGNTAAARINLWNAGWEQFINHPVFGNSLEVDAFRFYPHNLFIEVLLSTGIIGFIPFILLLMKGFKATINIFRNYPRYAWIGVLFLESFIQNMFSGAIYAASWFWLSLALLFSFESSLKK